VISPELHEVTASIVKYDNGNLSGFLREADMPVLPFPAGALAMPQGENSSAAAGQPQSKSMSASRSRLRHQDHRTPFC